VNSFLGLTGGSMVGLVLSLNLKFLLFRYLWGDGSFGW